MKKVVLISGGSDGLGRSIAEQLKSTYEVIILSPHKEKLEAVAAELDVDYYVVDVADYHAVEQVVADILQKHGRIDCLVNNAGLWIQGPLAENSPDRIKEVLEVNTLGTVNLSKAVIPSMKAAQRGLIINIISQAGFYAKAERTIYTASKFAITGFTKSLESELSPYGIAVTGLYPGKLKTKMFEKMGIEKDMSDALDPAVVAKTVEFVLSLGPDVVLPEIGIKRRGN